MCTGNGRWSRSIGPKLYYMPRFAMMYWRRGWEVSVGLRCGAFGEAIEKMEKGIKVEI